MSMTLAASDAALDEAAIAVFAATFRGELIAPADPRYEEARRVWNSMIDKRPALIARCTGTADVVAALRFARQQGLQIAVRGGGHNVAGNAVNNGGMVIDLSLMKGIQVDPVKRVARAQAGVVWGELDRETQRYGLAIPGGVVSSTGIAGFTLSGGMALTSRKWGLACDNLLAVEVVTADGEVLQASMTEHPDLFWAVRGGGGNFGVVTTFEFRLHPLATVYGGSVSYPFSEARQVLRRYRDFTDAAPDELTAFAGVLPLATGPTFAVAACWCGDPGRGADALAPLASFATPTDVALRAMPYLEMQSLLAPPPIRVAAHARSSILRVLGDDAIDAMVTYGGGTTPPALGVFFLEHLHGAATRAGDTAFSHRSAGHNFAALAFWMEPGDAEGSGAWVRGFSDALAPWFASGVYANYLDEGEDARVRAAYGLAYDRLVTVKRTYDPGNVFRLNQNIDPAAG